MRAARRSVTAVTTAVHMAAFTSVRPVCRVVVGKRRSASSMSAAPSRPAPYSIRSASLTRVRQRAAIARASRRLRTARRGSVWARVSQ